MATELVQKSSEKYCCQTCDYYTSRKSQLVRHNLTTKHINLTNSTDFNKKVPKSSATFVCNCGKKYKDRTGLWKHKNKCNLTEDNINVLEKEHNNSNEIQELKEIMKYLMKENSEMKNIILEVVKNGTHNNNSHNTTTNSHNKAFNLQFFLNETCKDAMNIMDFVESIKLQVSDLESVGELGYIEGISNIIVKNLNALDVTQRPVHCTDKKRETIYIKDDNKWEKDEEQKKMHKMIKKVADKNVRLLPKFTEKYPDYKNYHSKNSDKYSKIIVESMGGSGDNDYEKEEKIIKNIAKNILVEKGY